MANPIETLDRARRRIALVAGARTFAYCLAPVAVTLIAIVFMPALCEALWSGFGYVLDHTRVMFARQLLFAAAGAEVGVAACLAYRSWSRSRDFVEAAARVDQVLGANEQIVTLATLSDPAEPERRYPGRSPLFPVLWRRAIAFLELFNPRVAFPLRLGRPLARSTLLAAALAIFFVLSTFGLVRARTPLTAEAAHLRAIAETIEKTATTPGEHAAAASARAAADALENPNLPPEQKKQILERAKAQAQAAQNKGNATGISAGQKGSGSGHSPSNSEGEGTAEAQAQGKSNGNNSGGQGEGGQSAANQGSGGKGKGDNKNGNSGSGEKNASGEKNQNNIDLQNELAKAEVQVETQNAANQNPSAGGSSPGQAPKPGTNPNERGGSNGPNPNLAGDIPKQGAKGDKNIPAPGGNSQGADQGSNQGDTHIGEIPKGTNTLRFLKPGEKGAGVQIQDARYVQFRIPGATPVSNGGATVFDRNGPRASTPYVNAPLAPVRGSAEPDEQQLVPPRYRDLIQ